MLTQKFFEVVGMKKKRTGVVGIFSIDKSGKGKIDIIPKQNTTLPFKDGDEVTVVIDK